MKNVRNPNNMTARDSDAGRSLLRARGMNWFLILIIAIGVMMLGTCEPLAEQSPESSPSPGASSTSIDRFEVKDIERDLGLFARLAKDLTPSVVNVRVQKRQIGLHLRAPDDERQVRGQGSGFVLSSDGYILTNRHVVARANRIEVSLHDGTMLSAELIGSDAQTDLALLKVETSKALQAVELGDSEGLQVGDWVMAIGNPFGLEATVTVGVLSGKQRVLGAGPYDNFLQTDASINPGNSGGPLFDIQGRVVGINTAIAGQGIGFAVPINLAEHIVGQLRKHGRVVRGYVGLAIQGLTPELKAGLEIPDQVQGVLIASVVAGGPGHRAGIKVGDVVTNFDHVKITSHRQLLRKVADTAVGREVLVVVFRDGKSREFSITTTQRPDKETAKTDTSTPELNGFGLSVGDLGSEQVESLGTSGVVVTHIQPGSRADLAGLRPLDIISRVGTKQVKNKAEFRELLGSVKDHVVFRVHRDKTSFFIVMRR